MPKKKKQKIVAPVKSLRIQELQYQKQLNKLSKLLIEAVNVEVMPYLKANQASYVADGVGSQLGVIFKRLNAKFSGTIVASFAQTTASTMVTKTLTTNKERFDKTVYRATGVDLGAIISVEGLDDFVATSVNKNVGLITNMQEKYLNQIETIVNNGVASGASYSTIAKEIKGIKGANGDLARRAKTIARNEISTINAQINKKRSEALGVKQGIWRTSEDERVRGNPSGKYPKARPSHFKANGKKFSLKKGLKIDGQWIFPGIPINCRCTYSPILEV